LTYERFWIKALNLIMYLNNYEISTYLWSDGVLFSFVSNVKLNPLVLNLVSNLQVLLNGLNAITATKQTVKKPAKSILYIIS
jgi:hypothetical protein